MPEQTEFPHIAAAQCLGVKVPESPFLNERRIERINAARYEGQEISGALAVTRPGDRVLEMGAGLGIVGAVVAKNRAPVTLRAFEANPNLLPHIEELYAVNALPDAAITQKVLLSAPQIPNSVTFYLRNSFLGSSLHDSALPTEPVQVRTCDFNLYCAGFQPDVLLIDIEGGEMELLNDADLSDIRAIVIEFHPDHYGIDGMRHCKRLLQMAGFTKLPEHCTRTVWTMERLPDPAE